MASELELRAEVAALADRITQAIIIGIRAALDHERAAILAALEALQQFEHADEDDSFMALCAADAFEVVRGRK